MIYRIALAAHVVFDVKADSAEEALKLAHETQLGNDHGWDVPGGPIRDGLLVGSARCYIDTSAPAPANDAIQEERDEDF